MSKEEHYIMRTIPGDAEKYLIKRGALNTPVSGLFHGEGDSDALNFGSDQLWQVIRVDDPCGDLFLHRNTTGAVNLKHGYIIYTGQQDVATQLMQKKHPTAKIVGLIATCGNNEELHGGSHCRLVGGNDSILHGREKSTLVGGARSCFVVDSGSYLYGGSDCVMRAGSSCLLIAGPGTRMIAGINSRLLWYFYSPIGKFQELVTLNLGVDGSSPYIEYVCDHHGNLYDQRGFQIRKGVIE